MAVGLGKPAQPAAIPKTMRAAVLDRPGPAEGFKIKTVPVPRLGRDHVLIAVDYASVGSWDAKERSGEWRDIKPGTILGADGSGTVAALASDVKGLSVGDRVYSYSYDNPSGGFYAEYVSVAAARVAPVPPQLDQAIAGAIPCAAITAHAGLRVLEPKRGQMLLVFGSSGGVGSIAVWLGAHDAGAIVTGAARPDAHAYVRELGAAHAIDPLSSGVEAVIKRVAPAGFDAAFITANGDDLEPFLNHLRPGAPVAYPNGVEPEPKAEGHPVRAFDGEMSHEAFVRLNRAIGERTIPLRLEVFSLDDVARAHRRVEKGHVIGKIVLRIH